MNQQGSQKMHCTAKDGQIIFRCDKLPPPSFLFPYPKNELLCFREFAMLQNKVSWLHFSAFHSDLPEIKTRDDGNIALWKKVYDWLKNEKPPFLRAQPRHWCWRSWLSFVFCSLRSNGHTIITDKTNNLVIIEQASFSFSLKDVPYSNETCRTLRGSQQQIARKHHVTN